MTSWPDTARSAIHNPPETSYPTDIATGWFFSPMHHVLKSDDRLCVDTGRD